jgi:hypothetical protein
MHLNLLPRIPVSFDYGDIHFVVLDSSQSQYGPMLTWLRKDLLSINSPLLAHANATGDLAPHRYIPPGLQRPRSRRPTWLIAIVHAAPYSKVCRGWVFVHNHYVHPGVNAAEHTGDDI